MRSSLDASLLSALPPSGASQRGSRAAADGRNRAEVTPFEVPASRNDRLIPTPPRPAAQRGAPPQAGGHRTTDEAAQVPLREARRDGPRDQDPRSIRETGYTPARSDAPERSDEGSRSASGRRSEGAEDNEPPASAQPIDSAAAPAPDPSSVDAGEIVLPGDVPAGETDTAAESEEGDGEVPGPGTEAGAGDAPALQPPSSPIPMPPPIEAQAPLQETTFPSPEAGPAEAVDFTETAGPGAPTDPAAGEAPAPGEAAVPLPPETAGLKASGVGASPTQETGLPRALEAIGAQGREIPEGLRHAGAVQAEAGARPGAAEPKGAEASALPGALQDTGPEAPSPGSGGPRIDFPALGDSQSQRASGLPETARAATEAARPPVPVMSQVPLGAVPLEIGLKSLAGINRFEIRLDPVELGRIDVSLEIGEGGEVKAHLVVDRVETLALLQRDAKTLERAFEQAGLRPSEGGVDLSLRDPSDNRRQQGQRDGREGPDARATPTEATDSPAPIAPPRSIWRGSAGVDVRI